MTALSAMTAVAVTLIIAIAAGRRLHGFLPDNHLNADSRDAIKIAVGLVVTMTALLLGLLISSAKNNYDVQRSQVIQMAAKVAFLDRLLELYGPDGTNARTTLHTAVEDALHRIWPDDSKTPAELAPNRSAGDALYLALQQLQPQDDAQRALKQQAVALALDLAQLRMLLQAQSVPAVSRTLLLAVVSWLIVIFACFSMLAPPNGTTAMALVAAACCVSVAVFMILELDQPFDGLLRISSAPIAAVAVMAP